MAPQLLALAIDVDVATPREIDAFERTGTVIGRRENLLDVHVAPTVHYQTFARLQLFHLLDREVHGGLYDRTFRCYDYNLVVGIIEGRAYAPRVTKGEHVAAAGHTADDVTAIPDARRFLEYLGQIQVVLDRLGNFYIVEPLLLVEVVQPLVLHIKGMPQLFQQDKGIGIAAGGVAPWPQCSRISRRRWSC